MDLIANNASQSVRRWIYR